MGSDSLIGGSIKAYCSACEGDRNCEIRGHYPERGTEAHGHFQWSVDWYILSCRGCDNTFAQTVSSDSENYHSFYDEEGLEATEYIEAIDTWPARSKRATPDWFKRDVIETDIPDTGALEASLKEVYGALNQDLLVLASIGVRTSFDIASELLGVDANKTFQKKLDDLVKGAHITEADREHVETLVDAGSAAAHRGWQPSPGDLGTLMSVLENFIYNTMVVPARKRAHEAEVKKVRRKVPARTKKKKAD